MLTAIKNARDASAILTTQAISHRLYAEALHCVLK